MILIPGLASSGDTWKTTVARYQDRFTCHVLTLAGFAGNPPIDAPVFATARRELADYIRDQHLDRPVIVGHSLGGTLALALGADHPELVGPLVIVDGLPFLAGATLDAKTAADVKPQVAGMRAYFSTMTRAQYEDYARSGAATRSMVIAEADHDIIKSWSMASDTKTVGNAMADLYELDLRENLSAIASPTLVIGTWAGLEEPIRASGNSTPRAAVVSQFESQFARVRQLHFALAEHARHFVMYDEPVWFFDELDRFLANPAAAVKSRGFDARATVSAR